MSNYKFKQVDFDNPSVLFKLEDSLKGIIGIPLLYGPYVKTFELKGSEKILDFGCGGGVESKCLLRYLNDEGKIVCVDISNYFVKKAKKRLAKYKNADIIHGDIRKIELPKDYFDVITIMHVLHDIHPDERQAIVDEFPKLLKKDGVLFIWEPIKLSHGMSYEEIRLLMKNAGLTEENSSISKSAYKGKFTR